MPTSPEELTQITARHQFFVERYKSAEVKKFEKFLLDMAGVVRVKIGDDELSEFSRTRLNKLNAEIDKALVAIYQGYEPVWRDGILEFGKYESEFEIKSLKQVVDYDFALPSASQIEQAVFGNPMAVQGTYNGFFLGDMVSDLSGKTIKRVNGAINAGSARGLTTPEIVRSIIGTKKAGYADGLLSMSYKDANLLVRTGLQHTAGMARQRTWEQNSDIITGWRFRAVFDSRTTQQCRAIDQMDKVYEIGKGPLPPLHPFACLEDTKITTLLGLKKIQDVCVGDYVLTHTGRWKPVTTVMARWHSGLARDLIDNNGRSVSLTNEHPILTLSKGWIEAGQVETGDIFFNNTKKFFWSRYWDFRPKIMQSILINSHNIVTKLTDELVSLGIFSSSAGVSSAVSLNDSISDYKVGVVCKNKPLKNIFAADAIKNSAKNFLMSCGVFSERTLHGASNSLPYGNIMRGVSLFHSLRAFCCASRKCIRVSFAPVRLSSGHGEVLGIIPTRFRFALCFYSIFNGIFSNGIIGKAKLSLNKSKAFAVSIMLKFDNIFNSYIIHNSSRWFYTSCTQIVEYHYCGYVYNLSVEDDETYLANGVLVHNCRSSSVAALDDSFDFLSEGATRSARDKDGVTSVDADLGYYNWMKKQPAAFQDAALGKSWGKLLRDGGLSADRYAEISVGKMGEPLTLAQARELDPVAFSKAGL